MIKLKLLIDLLLNSLRKAALILVRVSRIPPIGIFLLQSKCRLKKKLAKKMDKVKPNFKPDHDRVRDR